MVTLHLLLYASILPCGVILLKEAGKTVGMLLTRGSLTFPSTCCLATTTQTNPLIRNIGDQLQVATDKFDLTQNLYINGVVSSSKCKWWVCCSHGLVYAIVHA